MRAWRSRRSRRSRRSMTRSARVRNALILPPKIASSDTYKKILRQEYRHHHGLDFEHGPPTPPPTRGQPNQRFEKNSRDALRDHRAEGLRFS